VNKYTRLYGMGKTYFHRAREFNKHSLKTARRILRALKHRMKREEMRFQQKDSES